MAERGMFGCIIKVAFVFAIFILLPNAFNAKFVLVKTSSQSAVIPKFLAVDNGDGTKTLLQLEGNSSISNSTKPQEGIITQNVLGNPISVEIITFYDIIIMKLAPIVQNRFTNRTLWTYSGS